MKANPGRPQMLLGGQSVGPVCSINLAASAFLATFSVGIREGRDAHTQRETETKVVKMNSRNAASPPMSKKEMAKKICYGMVITSVWLGEIGVLWWGVGEFAKRIKFVEDYAVFVADDLGQGGFGSEDSLLI